MRISSKEVCSVEGCDKPARSKGMCPNHYKQWLIRQPVPPGKECQQEGCGKLAQYQGFCRRHYRWRKESKSFERLQDRKCRFCKGPMPPEARVDHEFCSISCKAKWHRKEGNNSDERILLHRGSCNYKGCEGALHAQGLCRKHYMYVWRHDNVDHQKKEVSTAPCEIEGCEEIGSWKGLCKKHYHQKYLKENRESIYATNDARRNKERVAQPPWIDNAAVKAVYLKAKEISAITGELHHVDHIIPLRGRTVSGLHVPWNLQIIPADENRRKSAKCDEAEPILCKEEGCLEAAELRGMCKKHYDYWRYHNVVKPMREAKKHDMDDI